MNHFRTTFCTLVCLRLRLRRTWALLLLPLVTHLLVSFYPISELAAPVQVGVCIAAETDGAESFWRRLESRSGTIVTFIRAEEAAVRSQVAASQWDCGILIPPDFDQRVNDLDTKGLFTLLTGPGSTVYPIVQETVAACLAEQISPEIAESYLISSGLASAQGVEAMRPLLEASLPSEDRILLSPQTLNGELLDVPTLAHSGLSNILSGVIAILLLIQTLFISIDLGRWMETPFAKRIAPLQSQTALLLPRITATMLPAVCAAALALMALPESTNHLLSLTGYGVFLSALALVLARFPTVWNALPILVPFVPPTALLLSPVIFDLAVLFPAVSVWTKWLPVSLYLQGCSGKTEGMLLLLAFAILLFLLSYLFDQKKRPAVS